MNKVGNCKQGNVVLTKVKDVEQMWQEASMVGAQHRCELESKMQVNRRWEQGWAA